MILIFFSVTFLLCFAFHIHKLSFKKSICLLLSLSFVFIYANTVLFLSFSFQSNFILIDDNWQFSIDKQIWLNISLPHGIQTNQTCFYRKQLIINDNSMDFILRFDGVIDETDVYINNEFVRKHIGDYLPFDINLPTHRNSTLNILVHLRNSTRNFSQISTVGLQRHVWLIKKSKFVYLNETIRIDYRNVTNEQAYLFVQFEIIGQLKNINRCHVRFLLNDYEIYPLNLTNMNQAVILIENPRLWSIAEPNLYRFMIELVDIESRTIQFDQRTINIGIRSIEFLRFNGINRYEQYPHIGSALSDAAHYRDAYKIKQAGIQIVHCIDHIPAIEFLNACDQLGLLVMNSIVIDKESKDEIMKRWFQRDYNHPSIFIWRIDSVTKGMINRTYRQSQNLQEMNRKLFIEEYSDSKDKISLNEKSLMEQAVKIQRIYNQNRLSSQVLGDISWSMFNDHTSSLMNINRLPTFAYYFYQSQCTSCPPMIFIANYWTDSSMTNVTIYTNCDQVELRLNGHLIKNGGKETNENTAHLLLRPPFIFQIEQFTPGRLEAIGFIKDKSVIRTHRLTPNKLADHLEIKIDLSGKLLTMNDIVFVYAYIYDANNTLVFHANDLIEFSCQQALLIGQNPVEADNGIASILLKTNSMMSDKKLTISAFSLTVKEQRTSFVIEIFS